MASVGIAAVVHQDFLRGDDDGAGVAIGLDVERRRWARTSSGSATPGCRPSRRGTCTRCTDCEALMRAVFFEVCQRLTVVSYCMPGSPQCQVASEILRSSSRALEGLHRTAVLHRAGGEVAVAQHGVHEVVGDAHRVVGVLEEDGRVGVAVGTAAVVAVPRPAPRPWLLPSACTR